MLKHIYTIENVLLVAVVLAAAVVLIAAGISCGPTACLGG
jgi:hypothetical protein